MVRKVIMGELKNMKEGKSVGMSSNVVEMLKNGSIYILYVLGKVLDY